MYKLPLGIKIPTKDDNPEEFDVEIIDSQRNAANIVMG